MDKQKVKEALKAIVAVNNSIILDDNFVKASASKYYNGVLANAIRIIKEELGIIDNLGELEE